MTVSVVAAFRTLLARYSAQAWWPAQTPFEVMIGAILVQQTVWRNAERAVERLRATQRLTAHALEATGQSELEALIKPCGFYRTKARRLLGLARFVRLAGGLRALDRLSTSELRAGLLGVEGIGPETADAILLYAFERPVFVMDAYARRLFARLGADCPERELKDEAERALGDVQRLNEFHALIVEHGKRHCRSEPLCAGCCLRAQCRYAASR